jgi:hypothetical protein
LAQRSTTQRVGATRPAGVIGRRAITVPVSSKISMAAKAGCRKRLTRRSASTFASANVVAFSFRVSRIPTVRPEPVVTTIWNVKAMPKPSHSERAQAAGQPCGDYSRPHRASAPQRTRRLARRQNCSTQLAMYEPINRRVLKSRERKVPSVTASACPLWSALEPLTDLFALHVSRREAN